MEFDSNPPPEESQEDLEPEKSPQWEAPWKLSPATGFILHERSASDGQLRVALPMIVDARYPLNGSASAREETRGRRRCVGEWSVKTFCGATSETRSPGLGWLEPLVAGLVKCVFKRL